MTSTLCAAMFSNSCVKWRLGYVVLGFVTVPFFQYQYFLLAFLNFGDQSKRAMTHCKDTIPKIRNKYSQKRNCAASVAIPPCVFERFIYSHDLFAYSAAGKYGKYVDRSSEYLHKSLTDILMWKFGLKPRNSSSGNPKMEFSLRCR